MKKLLMTLVIVAAMVAAFLAGAAVMAHSTTTVRMSSNLREAGEETIYWENAEVETF